MASNSTSLANSIYHTGSVSGNTLNTAQEQWGTVYEQLLSCGFDSAAVEWVNQGGVPNVDANLLGQLYRYLCTNAGLTQGYGYFYHNLYGAINASVLNEKWTGCSWPTIQSYGVPQSNFGHQVALAHFAQQLGGSSAELSDAPLTWPAIGRVQLTDRPASIGRIQPANRPAPPPPPGRGSEDYCWYINAFLAYVGIMAIPLGLEGAAFPPLGTGLGIAVAFASAFSWGFCG